MTTIMIDDEMISELVVVRHFKNAQEAVIKIVADYFYEPLKKILEQPKGNFYGRN
jgi:hypothetical protein